MSEDTEAESTNTSEIINEQKNNKILNDNIDIKELLKIPFIKDLQIKLEVLKNGIITERKKNKIMETQIKQLEGEITSKTEQIKNLSKEKLEIENQLALEKKQLEKKEEDLQKMVSVLNSSNKNNLNQNKENNDNINEKKQVSLMANEEVKKLNEEITQLKFENETYLKNMNKTLEDTENKRLEYKNEIKSYTNKIKNLEEKVTNLQKEKKELQDRINLTSSISSQTLKEKEHFKGLALDYQKGKEELEQQLNSCLEKYNKLSEENESNKQAILRHEINSGKMAQKLAELKSLYIKVNLRNQMFHVKKEGLISNTEIDIIFGKDDEGNYVMRIDDKNHKELINIQDVESINRVENSKNRVEISYMYKAKKYNMTVVVDELIVEQFVEAYKIFYWESMKDQNKINY